MIRKTVLFGVFAACTSAAVPGAQATAVGQTEYVYVETNLKPANSIRVFERGAGGPLQEIAGSPFLTGGAGSGYSGTAGGPDDSDQEIVLSQDRSLLFAINAGSDSISVFRIGGNGTLAAVEGSPFASGGNDPVSLDVEGNTLFVANKAGDPSRPTAILPNYTSLRIGGDGSLSPTADTVNDTTRPFDTTVSVEVGSSPEQVHVVPGTSLVIGDDLLGGVLQRFAVDEVGGLHQLSTIAAPTSIFSDTVTARNLQGVWSHPSAPILYVGAPTVNKLLVYRYDRADRLTFERAIPNQGEGICWLRTNRAGTRLYTTETGSNTVGVYDISDAANPVQLQEFQLSGQGNSFQLSLSVDEKNLYVLSPRAVPTVPLGQGNVLHSLTIEGDGRVSETLAPIPFSSPSHARPRGLVVVAAR